MMKRMSGIVAIVGMSLMGSQAALAEDVVITTGSPGGTYHNVLGANLGRIMAEQGNKVELQTSAGSVENIQRVVSGEADFGFTQADALGSFLEQNPSSNVEILGGLGQECIYVVVPEDGIDNEDGLEQEGTKIAVGEKGSGSAESWDYMRTLETGYKESSTYYKGGVRAIAQVKTGQLDAFMWVTSPFNLNHDFLKAVMQDDSGLRLIDMNDWDMNNELPNGQSVYEFKEVVVKEGFINDTEVETACTQVMVIGNPELDGLTLEAAAKAVMMNGNRIQGL